MRDRVCLRIFTKCAKETCKNWLLLAFMFPIIISFPWKSVGVECSKSGVEKLSRVDKNISVGTLDMTVISNALSFKEVEDEPNLNKTEVESNSTVELTLTTKRSLPGHSKTPIPATEPVQIVTESIKEVDKVSNEDEDSTSLENELEQSEVHSEIENADETGNPISRELEAEIASGDEVASETETEDSQTEPVSSNEIQYYRDDVMSSSVTPQYKMTSVVTTSASFTTRTLEESNESPETDIIFISSTPRTLGKVTYIKKIPTRLIAASNTRIKHKQKLTKLSTTTTVRPTKKVMISTSKKPARVTKAPKPKTTTSKAPQHERHPHHPHGVVIFDKRKKRPRPFRRTTTPTTTTTTTSTTTKAPTTSPEPNLDYYDYYLSSGETSIEIPGTNSSNGNKPNRIPLSKLALAMLASSTGFENGTEDPMYFPKTPVNLLNILQAYTKQLEVASTETFKPPLKIDRQPFMVHLNGLNFAAKVGISVYYSLIAIIPLVYLAFGGLGRLGFNAFVGRNLGTVGRKKKRRRRRSFNEDFYHYHGGYNNNFSKGSFTANTIKRIHLKDQENEDEYSWILGRISEVIWELSQVPYELNHQV